MTPLPPELKRRILQAARQEPSPTRAIASRQGALVCAAGLVGLAGVFFAVGGLHPGDRPVAHLVGTALGWAMVAVAATWQAVGRGGSMLGRPRDRLLWLVAATPLVLLAWLSFWDARYPEAVVDCSFGHGLKCLGLSLALASAPLIAFTLARRQSDPVHPRSTAAALGAAAGAWAAVMIDLRCPFASLTHVALGHALPVLVLAGLGAWIGGGIIAVRGAREG